MSLNGVQHGSLFTVYFFSFKGFKNQFFKVFNHKDPRKMIFYHVDGSTKFPLYWHRPYKFKSKVEHFVNEEEIIDIVVLKSLPRPINSWALLRVLLAKNPIMVFTSES